MRPDLALRWENARRAGDIAGWADDALGDSILVALLCDRRATPAEAAAIGASDRGGWWGDVVAPQVAGRPLAGYHLGSRLWLLRRAKQTEDTRAAAERYAREALAYLLDTGAAERLDVVADWAAPSVLRLTIGIARRSRTTQWTVEIAL